MPSLGLIREGLQTRLAEITELHCYDRVPDNIVVPAAVVGVPELIEFNVTMGPTFVQYTIPIRVYVQRTDGPLAQSQLDTFIEPTGSASVKLAIEDKDITVAAGWHFVNVGEARDYGEYDIADVKYLGVEFAVVVVAA